MLDPSLREEAAKGSSCTVLVNAVGDVCGLHKPGGLPVPPSQLLRSIRIAASTASDMLKKVQAKVRGSRGKAEDGGVGGKGGQRGGIEGGGDEEMEVRGGVHVGNIRPALPVRLGNRCFEERTAPTIWCVAMDDRWRIATSNG